jgi:hypothetical protein
VSDGYSDVIADMALYRRHAESCTSVAVLRADLAQALGALEFAVATIAQLRAAGVVEDVSQAAVILGRAGGRVGGMARDASLTPERRSEIARKAARARWGGP